MIHFKKGQVPDKEYSYAIKKPIPQRVIQIEEAFKVDTMEGTLDAKAGDFLMIGIKGEMWPVDQEIFYQTYDLLDPTDPRHP
jgi:hypothetical protein